MHDFRINQPLHFATGLAALSAGLYSLHQGVGVEIVILLATFFLFSIVITDTFYRKIPNLFCLVCILCGFAWHLMAQGAAGMLTAGLGLCAGLALLFPYYLLGGMGAGDVKALAALGSLAGPAGIFQIFLYTSLIGGLLALLHYALTYNLWQKSLAGLSALRTFIYTRDYNCLKPDPGRERQRFPYAAAIALGFFAFVQWGPIVKLPL